MTNLQQLKDRATRAKELADKATEEYKMDVPKISFGGRATVANIKQVAAFHKRRDELREQAVLQHVPQLATDVLLLAEVVAGLMEVMEVMEKLTISEENIDRIDQVPLEQLRILVLHTGHCARHALSTAREKLGGSDE